jgi:hypothetical protein
MLAQGTGAAAFAISGALCGNLADGADDDLAFLLYGIMVSHIYFNIYIYIFIIPFLHSCMHIYIHMRVQQYVNYILYLISVLYHTMCT